MAKSSKKTKKKVADILPLPIFIIPVSIAFIVLLIALLLKGGAVSFQNSKPTASKTPIQMNEATSELPKSIPEGFPSDFPVYENAALEESWRSEGESVEAYSLVWTTSDSMEVVADFYASALPASGFSIVSESQLVDSYVVTFSKEGSDGYVGIAKDTNETVISVNIGIEEMGEPSL